MLLSVQQAWQLHNYGVDHAKIAAYATEHNLEFPQAAAKLWEEIWLSKLIFEHTH